MTALDELQQTVQEQALPRRARRLVIVLAMICGVLLLLPSLIFGWRLHTQSEFIAADQASDAQRDADYQELFEACAEATDCEVGDVPSPDEVEEEAAPVPPGVSVAGAPGPQGPRGESGSDGEAGSDGAPGPVGPIGPPGPNGEVGSAGSDGANGADGSNGSAGAPGESIVGPQGEQGVAGPQGLPGAPGTPGANGADGRGIASLLCGDDGRWTVTYTDGTTADAGQCRVDPIVTPPDPEPTDPPIIDLDL